MRDGNDDHHERRMLLEKKAINTKAKAFKCLS